MQECEEEIAREPHWLDERVRGVRVWMSQREREAHRVTNRQIKILHRLKMTND